SFDSTQGSLQTGSAEASPYRAMLERTGSSEATSALAPPPPRRRRMRDPEPQTAGGKVLWHFTMSLDGFVAGPNHEMDWMTGVSFRPHLVEEYLETTGAVLGAETVGTTTLTPVA